MKMRRLPVGRLAGRAAIGQQESAAKRGKNDLDSESDALAQRPGSHLAGRLTAGLPWDPSRSPGALGPAYLITINAARISWTDFGCVEGIRWRVEALVGRIKAQ